MTDDHSLRSVSRRAVLQAAGTATALSGVGAARVTGDSPAATPFTCPDASVQPRTEHCAGSTGAACADDHPATDEIQREVDRVLTDQYPTVGALIDDGFLPYFDLFSDAEEGGWSHWLNPDYIGDDSVLDPERPESVLVDNRWWRPMGVMFIATREGDAVAEPQAVYETDEGERCAPWHYHVGLPGRYGWWKYRLVYEDPDHTPAFPCRTPCMLHVWTYPNPDGVYAHGAPPPGNRGGPPAEPAGFETDADPDSDHLDRQAVLEAVATEVLSGVGWTSRFR